MGTTRIATSASLAAADGFSSRARNSASPAAHAINTDTATTPRRLTPALPRLNDRSRGYWARGYRIQVWSGYDLDDSAGTAVTCTGPLSVWRDLKPASPPKNLRVYV